MQRKRAPMPGKLIAIEDISKILASKAQRVVDQAAGSVELAYRRGYQGGYEQALHDMRTDDLDPHHALEPHRLQERRAKRPKRTE